MGTFLQSESERGKFDFDHYFAFLTNIFYGSSRESFSKKMCQKLTFPSDFVKLVFKMK